MHTKKINTFCYEIEQIIISSRTAGSTLQKRFLLYKTQKKQKANEKKNFFFCFIDFVDNVKFCYTVFIRYTNNN
jgi:hypothetical protein